MQNENFLKFRSKGGLRCAALIKLIAVSLILQTVLPTSISAALRNLPNRTRVSAVARSLKIAAKEVPSFLVSPTLISASPEATNGVVSVINGTSEEWSVSNSIPWITVNIVVPRSETNGTLTYSISPNTSCINRSGVFYVKTQAVTVNQAGVSASYALSSSAASFTTNGGSSSVSLTANCLWSVQNDAGWITITSAPNGSDNATITYSVAANGSNSSRSGSIKVYNGNSVLQKTLTVSQSGVPLTHSLNYTNALFTSDSGESNVVLTASAPWTAQTDVTWLTAVSPLSGNGNATITYKLSANSGSTARTGTLKILDSNSVVKQTLFIGQSSAAISYSLSSTNANFTSNGGSSNVQLTAGSSWTVQADVSWITGISPSSGVGDASIGYSVAANTSCGSRTGSIKILDGNLVVQKRLTVSQAGISGNFTTSYSYLLFPVNGGRISVGLTARCGWTAVSDVPWINNLAPSSGNTNATISYTVDQNTTTNARQGYIRILDSDSVVQQIVRVAQTGVAPTYFLNPTDSSFPASGGNSNATLTANSTWSAKSDVSWITGISPASGATNAVIQYTVQANTNSASRSGTITIYDGSLVAQQTLSIFQAGAASGLASRSSATSSSPTTLSDSRTTATSPDGSVFTAGSLSGLIYIGKATSDGEVLWMKWFEGTSGSVTGLSLDNSGNIYVAGEISGTIDFGGGALSSTNTGEVFIASLSADGAYLWSKLFGDFSTEQENSSAALNYLAQLPK